MALVQQAISVRGDRSTYRHSVAHRLRPLELEGDETKPSEEVHAVREQLQEAEKALHEAQVVIDNLNALVAKLSSDVDSDEGPITEDTSRHSMDAISITGSH
jgi:hypothetical protein